MALEVDCQLKTCPECRKEYEDALVECPIDSQTLKTSQNDPFIGTKLANRYEIISVVGRGGMGVVYKARHEMMDRFMAIKMLHSYMVAAPEAVKRFFQEAQTVSQVKHHHIVTLYDFGMSPQAQPFIVMDYLQGSDIKRVVKEGGPLSFERGEHILNQIVEALAAAHAKNVVHLDLKPENIVLTQQNGDSDWVTLVDFGLSKLEVQSAKEFSNNSKGGHICGSPPYMSPEQCQPGAVVDSRSDIYSLAVVIYEMLSNRLPFEAKSSLEMLECHRFATPLPFYLTQPELKVCTELTHVLNRAFEKEPDRRQQTVEEFGEEVHDAIMRDSVKLRTLKHRAEVGSLDGFFNRELVSQAAIVTSDQMEQIATQRYINQDMSKSQESGEPKGQDNYFFQTQAPPVAKNQKAAVVVDPKFVGCPFCDAPIEADLKFCLTCERQIVSPNEIYKLRGIGGTDGVPRLRSADRYSGKFSNRTKSANVTARRLFKIQSALKTVLLLVIVYALYVVCEQMKATTLLSHWLVGLFPHSKA
jgi:eukaryotic-like serine/threonine-protein kinase